MSYRGRVKNAVAFATAQLLPFVGRALPVLPGRFRRWASFNARSIFSTVRTVGECLPDSSRQRVSSRTPASRASSAWVNPSAFRCRMMSRAIEARR